MTEKPFGFSSRGCARAAIRSTTRPTVAARVAACHLHEVARADGILCDVATLTRCLCCARRRPSKWPKWPRGARLPSGSCGVWRADHRRTRTLLRAQSHLTQGGYPLRSPLSGLAMQSLAPSVLSNKRFCPVFGRSDCQAAGTNERELRSRNESTYTRSIFHAGFRAQTGRWFWVSWMRKLRRQVDGTSTRTGSTGTGTRVSRR